jgi:hypothetical protein
MTGSARTIFNEIVCHKKTKINITRQPTCLLRGGQGRQAGAMAGKTMSQLAAQNSMNSRRSKGMTVRTSGNPIVVVCYGTVRKMGARGTYYTKISDVAQLVSSTAKISVPDHQKGGTYHTKTSDMAPLRWYLP